MKSTSEHTTKAADGQALDDIQGSLDSIDAWGATQVGNVHDDFREAVEHISTLRNIIDLLLAERNGTADTADDLPFGDSVKSPCGTFTGYGNAECPKCGMCRKEILVPTGDYPPRPAGEVVRRTSWQAMYCPTCHTYSVSPCKLVYVGDGDYDRIGNDDFLHDLKISEGQWNKNHLWESGLVISKMMNVPFKVGDRVESKFRPWKAGTVKELHLSGMQWLLKVEWDNGAVAPMLDSEDVQSLVPPVAPAQADAPAGKALTKAQREALDVLKEGGKIILNRRGGHDLYDARNHHVRWIQASTVKALEDYKLIKFGVPQATRTVEYIYNG